MLLVAYSMGIGSCWVCDIPTSGKFHNIPKSYAVIALVVFGYPKKWPKEPKRKSDVFKLTKYGQPRFIRIRRFLRKYKKGDPYFCSKCGQHVSACRCSDER